MTAYILLAVVLILITDFCDTASQLFLKSAINSLDLHVNSIKKAILLAINLIKVPRVWFGFFFSVVSLSIWLYVLTKYDLNFAFSIDSMRYILITLASALILKEKVSVMRWLGIFAVVCGIALVAIG
ncbi:MAG: hypothetical protein NTZ63_05400 [Candidatus Omnitrophica bacterium]|nr:hypothetical protein [Candidatus Omnitrophota bacterium]